MGKSDQAGNFDGLLGMIQREEVDYATTQSRLDSLGHNSLRVLGVLGSAEVRILSKKVKHVNQSLTHFEPMLDTMSLVDEWSFSCLLVSVLLVAMVISVANSRAADKTTFRAKGLLRRYFQTLWALFELLVSQGKFIYVTTVPKLMWLTLTIGLFVIVSCVFMNLLSTEQVAQREPDQIDTFADLFDNFKWQEPTLFADLYTNSLRNLARNGSRENQLFERIKRNENNTYILPTQSNSSQELSQFTFNRYLDNGGRYLLLENSVWFPSIFCHIVPEKFDEVHESKETVLDGILVALYNSKSDPKLVKYMSYRLTNKLEFGFTAYENLRAVKETFDIMGYWELGKENATRCHFRDSSPEAESDMQFKLGYARSVLYFIGSAVFTAFLLNICEQCMKNASRRKTVMRPRQKVKRKSRISDPVYRHINNWMP
ncbi:hypothetical protein HDE_00335 [Halotydeus destructor]|nr:hypothetical protein HDE_00335 [Halotydeus destructor]